MFNKTKYSKWYHSIISSAHEREKFKGCERHHIIPKSCGGLNTSENIAFLTPREHFVCHLLLTKAMSTIKNTKKMEHALWWTAQHINKKGAISSRSFDKARRCLASAKIGVPRSDECKRKMSETLKAKLPGWTGWDGRTHKDETKQKMSEAAKARIRQPTSGETKQRISEANRGKKRSSAQVEKMKGQIRSAETRQRLSDSHKGFKITDATKEKISIANKGKPWSEARRSAENAKKLLNILDSDLNPSTLGCIQGLA